MMDVLVKAKTGMLGHFFCVVAAFLFVSCGWDLIDSDKEDENACSDKVERSDLMSGVEKIGGYSLHQTVHFVTSDSLQFDMQVTVVDDGYDERGCPDVDIVYGYRRVVLEGPNPLLSMGMSIQNQVYSEASVNIMIGAYNFAFRVEPDKNRCKALNQDSVFAHKKFCIADGNCSSSGCGTGGNVSHLDSLVLNGNVYRDVFRVKHSVYGSNRDNIYFSIDKGLLRFETEDGSFMEIREKKKGGVK